ncbi:Friend leukemia integration 1 transcription factor-like [Octopus sinensis]|uniref:Friend leukemia integration 1 transcription factor-like n=1 Tax=Octopus sinensis TaxID=2607531 RepID=A0A6P7TWJ6_9MOLL|nr:Friend leukemia integration 1 transcription factor-like [Octopus sinensis]
MGIFVITDGDLLAYWWGQCKQNPSMNEQKLSRALRTYYKYPKILKKVRHSRNTYMFLNRRTEQIPTHMSPEQTKEINIPNMSYPQYTVQTEEIQPQICQFYMPFEDPYYSYYVPNIYYPNYTSYDYNYSEDSNCLNRYSKELDDILFPLENEFGSTINDQALTEPDFYTSYYK